MLRPPSVQGALLPATARRASIALIYGMAETEFNRGFMPDYLQRMQTPRNVYVNGEPVHTLPLHPMFSGAIRFINRYYELQQQDPAVHLVNHAYATSLLIPHCIDDLKQKGRAYKAVADSSYGMLGRTPDFINSAIAAVASHAQTLGHDEYCDYADNARRYYDYCRENNLYVSHAAINPQVDRSRVMSELRSASVGVKVTHYDDNGITVNGAKMITTLTPVSDEILIFNMPGLTENDRDFAVAFTLDVTSPNLRMLCRKAMSYPEHSTLDHPIANLFDEIDCLLLLDNVQVPWERVLIFRNVEKSNAFYDTTKARNHTGHQGIIRGQAKAELMAGVATRIAQTLGLDRFLHVQEKLGRMTTSLELLKGAIQLAENAATIDDYGVCNPDISAIQAIRYHFPLWYKDMQQTLQSLCAGSMLSIPDAATLSTLPQQQLDELFDPHRTTLLNLGWDLTGDGFGQRQMVYEIYHAGDPLHIAAQHHQEYDTRGMLATLDQLLHSSIPGEKL